MKRALKANISLFLFVAVATAAHALTLTQANAVGSWDLTVDSPNGKRTVVLVIKREGDKLVGTLKSQRGERPLDSVTLKGNEITFVMTAQVQGQDMVMTYKGTVEKDSMKGDADFGGFATGTWSAVPHKEGDAAAPATPAAPSSTAPVSNISGVWNFAVETPAGTGNPVFTFKQDGENLTGTYKGQLGESAVTGTIKGGDVKFSIKVNVQGQDITINYMGKVEGSSSMSGTAQFGEMGEGKWTAKKQ